MPTEKETILTEEEKDTARFKELNDKPEIDKTADDKKEIGKLTERYGKRMQTKIDKMTRDRELERERADSAERERDEAKRRLEDLETSKDAAKEIIGNENEIIEFGSQKWLSDNALAARLKSGKITEQKAIEYQRARDKEEAVVEAVNRIEKKSTEEDFKKIKKEDARAILKIHPQFDKKHPEHNPEDPVYKLANELYYEGFVNNPRGFSLAVKRAKQILRISDTHIDRSEDLSLLDSGAPDKKKKEAETFLTEDEKEAAERMFTRGDVLNPKTNRAYTVAEAHAKALEGKKQRLALRR